MCLPPKLDDKNVQVTSGFETNRRKIELGLLLMSILYGLILSINPNITPAAKYCTQDDYNESGECRRADLLAYKVTSACSMFVMGTMGLKNWYFSKRLQQLSPQQQKRTTNSPEERIFGSLQAADNQNVVIFCYQVWDFMVSLTIPEHREIVFLVHHLLAGLTAYFSLDYQMVPYYSIFFGGCSEFSSIFLVFADADEFFPPKEGSMYGLFIEACKGLFVLTFFIYRVYGWIRQSVPLWKDTLHVLGTGSAEKYRPGKTSFLYVFLGLNVTLGALQLFWFGQIIQKVMETLE